LTEKLADEAYARAALTYLAEPADRRLGQLLRFHGAAATLDAIKAGYLPGEQPAEATAGTAHLTGLSDESDESDEEARGHRAPLGAGHGLPRRKARGAMKAAMERWRVRLPELPSPEEVLACRESGIRVITPGDPEWPGQLADLGDDQPYALWLRGNADLRFSCLRSVAIVGSRAATAYGAYVAAEFAASVAARGLAVVSGGAFGVDASAHRGALSAGGVTVAVLACGVDMPYPTAHAELFDAIAAQGAIASEWPPGRHVSRLRFLVRNRVIAALAPGTLVVEAAARSGALNTARHARDLRRRLMAVPGPVTSDLSAGSHQVIRDWQGALVTSAAEVVEHLSPVGMPLAAETGRGAEPSGRPAPAVLPRDLLDLESARVLDAMPRRGGMATVRVAQRAGLAPATTAACLGQLATGGFIERCDEGWRLRRS
jgi:DNA processing protein